VGLLDNPLSTESINVYIPQLEARGVYVEWSDTLQVTFPDANLEAAIRDAINKPEGSINRSDLESLTVLEWNSPLTPSDIAPESRISDLTGLEYCVNLQGLVLGGNNINDISPLTGLTNLLQLVLHNNNISDISALAGLTNLEVLVLGGNNISDISSMASLTNLQLLWLSYCNISDISPLAGLTNLYNLGLRGNNISDISPLVENSGLSTGDTVDLSGNPLSIESINVHIPQLIARGVDVAY
jgi:Leucine-rich repeat (LRR) protein